jgi:hypothetical protein
VSTACAVTLTLREPLDRSTEWVLNVTLVICGATVSAGGAHSLEAAGVAATAAAPPPATTGVKAPALSTATDEMTRSNPREPSDIAGLRSTPHIAPVHDNTV